MVNAVPEFDDCARLARERNLSVKEVQALAVQAYGTSRQETSLRRAVDSAFSKLASSEVFSARVTWAFAA